MSHRILVGIALALMMAAASSAPVPILASRAPPAIEDRSAYGIVGDVLVLAPQGPVTDACYTEYTGDGATDFSSPDAQALRDAVAVAAPGTTVKVAGACAGAILEGGSTQVALVTTTLTLIGGYTPTDWANSYPLTQPTTLDALGAGRVFYFSGVDGELANLTVQNGKVSDGNGGGLYASRAITLTQVSVIRNTAQYDGGGLFAAGSAAIFSSLFVSNTTTPTPNGYGSGGGAYVKDSAVVERVRFEQNQSAYFGGGLEVFTGTTVISDTAFFTNATVLAGGGVYVNRGVAHVVNALFTNNQVSEYDGGGLQFSGSALTITNSSFFSNTAHEAGGGAFSAVYGVATVIGGRFQGNVASTGDGGGLWAFGLTMRGTELIGNTAQRSGGGARAYGATAISDGLFQDNRAVTCVGGGLLQDNRYHTCDNSFPPTISTLAMTDTQFVGNAAGQDGGGLFAESAVTATGTQFISNTAQRNSGGVWAIGAITLTGGLFSNNVARNGTGGGLIAHNALTLKRTQFLSNTAQYYAGGAVAYGLATVEGGWFENNWARVGGGGLLAANGVALTGTRFLGNLSGIGGSLYQTRGNGRIVNALFARNVASTTLGSAMYFSSTGEVNVLHTTIASPTVGDGAAIHVLAGTIRLTDTLIASYTVGISNAGGTANENYTLFDGVATPRGGAVGPGANSITGTALFVNPAADDYHLALGGAAINGGVNAGVFLDFEGTPRPFGGGFDIGYDEWGVPLQAFLPAALR